MDRPSDRLRHVVARAVDRKRRERYKIAGLDLDRNKLFSGRDRVGNVPLPGVFFCWSQAVQVAARNKLNGAQTHIDID